MRTSLATITLVALVACARPPSIEDLGKMYVSNEKAFEDLRAMALEDVGTHGCLHIGTKRVGHYQKFGDQWVDLSKNHEKMKLAQVLDVTGVEAARFRAYEDRLTSLGAISVYVCQQKGSGAQVTITVSHSNFCEGRVHWSENPIPQVPHGTSDDPNGQMILRGGWSVELDCS